MILGQKIKKLRELKNFTQEFMAKELDLTQSAYSKIENGEDIPFSKLKQIAKVLGISAEDIIKFNEHMVFNVMHNETGNGLVINQTSPAEKVLYEKQIESLQKEIEHLKAIIEKLLMGK